MAMDIDPGYGAIFKNDKEGVEKRPDYSGEIKTPSGEHLQIALWVKTAKSGSRYMSAKVQRPDQNGGQTTTGDAREAAAAASTHADDDIPF